MWDGQVTVFAPGGPSFDDLYPVTPDAADLPSCEAVGVMGPLKGAILIGMSIDDAQQFASKMMMGMPVSDLDELAQSALAEMGNMVCANACSLFSQAGTVGLDISPPSLLVGKGAHVRVSVSQMVVVNFSADGIAVDIYAGLF